MNTATTYPQPANEIERAAQIQFAERIKAAYDADGLTPDRYPPYQHLLEHLNQLKQLVFSE
jgi:hypothetical protein